jgi:hypothetical protein
MTDKLITVSHQQAMLLKEGDLSTFILNMVRLGSSLEGEPESIKGPYLSEDDDGKLFVIRVKPNQGREA